MLYASPTMTPRVVKHATTKERVGLCAEERALKANLLVAFKLGGSGVAPPGGLLVTEKDVLSPRCRCTEVGDVSATLLLLTVLAVPPPASPGEAPGAEFGASDDDDSPIWPEVGAPLMGSLVVRSLEFEFDEMLVSPHVLLALLDSLFSTPRSRSSGIVGELAPAKSQFAWFARVIACNSQQTSTQYS
ncbi:unnamed protein product [Toxocara canis]|uniref:Uncharacterized protein n=1 Tax=Toxocara canis TaxID=6265 RepID=A0A183U3D6_TOXCA|nr:unnamed protein product [Toxocara canis]